MQTIKLWATKGHRQDMWLSIVDLRRMWGSVEMRDLVACGLTDISFALKRPRNMAMY